MSYFTIDELCIASPCDVAWSSMKGSTSVRHCDQCEKNVYNLSLLTRAEANALIFEKEGKLCVQLYKRFDGTVLTADCPKGLRAMRRKYLVARVKVIGAVLVLASFMGFGMGSCSSVNPLGVPVANPADSTHHG